MTPIAPAAELTAAISGRILQAELFGFPTRASQDFMLAIFPPSTRCIVLAFLAAGLAYWAACPDRIATAQPAKEKEAAKDTVSLVVDYGDGVQKQFRALPWTKESTVLAALEAAAKHPRGVKFTHQGKGETVLVTAIDDLKNEGRGRNWLYEVNGKLGDRSCAVMPLKAGDSVLWRFGKYQ